jgi:uncharacterized protein
MNYIYDDDYMMIIENILSNSEFIKLKNAKHHGDNRLDHSLRVSYSAYKLSKLLGLDYVSTARAGLLHDFFFSSENPTAKELFRCNFTHAREAANNAIKHFNISPKEEDIIVSHMFPVNIVPPKYMEGWVVTMADKAIATCEHLACWSRKLKLATNLFILFIINCLR